MKQCNIDLRLFFGAILLARSLWGAAPSEAPSQVPEKYAFIRTLDVEGGAMMRGRDHRGAQFFRVETRYRDPDVNAFVGLITTVSRFNDDLRMGDPDDPTLASFIWNWGADIGIVRGAHTWAIDLMGASLGEHIAFGPALVGEHNLGKRLQLFHRTAIDMFVGDTVLDSDQGLMWCPWEGIGLTAGYRVFAMKHSNRNGPRVGLVIHFNIPRMPFIFPSIG